MAHLAPYRRRVIALLEAIPLQGYAIAYEQSLSFFIAVYNLFIKQPAVDINAREI